MRLALTVVDWMKNRDNKRMLNVFRRAPTRSPHREVGGRPFLRELRDQRENTAPSSPPPVSSQCGGYDSETRVKTESTPGFWQNSQREKYKKSNRLSLVEKRMSSVAASGTFFSWYLPAV